MGYVPLWYRVLEPCNRPPKQVLAPPRVLHKTHENVHGRAALVQTLRMLASDNLWIDSDDDEGMGWKGRGKRDREDSGIGGHEDEDAQEAGRARSVMIFVSKCRR